MGKATRREINQSVTDHSDKGNQQRKRHSDRSWGAHTSESPRSRVPMYNRAQADERDRFWRSLGKQVASGAVITVRG